MVLMATKREDSVLQVGNIRYSFFLEYVDEGNILAVSFRAVPGVLYRHNKAQRVHFNLMALLQLRVRTAYILQRMCCVTSPLGIQLALN